VNQMPADSGIVPVSRPSGDLVLVSHRKADPP
jgi:hypothetical protein